MAQGEAKVEADLCLSSDSLCEVRHDHWEGLRGIFLDPELTRAVVQTPRKNVPVLVDQNRCFFTHADLHDSLISPEFLRLKQMMSWVKSGSPDEESSILCHRCRMSASLDILDKHILEPMHFQGNVGGELVALSEVARRVVTHPVNLVLVGEEERVIDATGSSFHLVVKAGQEGHLVDFIVLTLHAKLAFPVVSSHKD